MNRAVLHQSAEEIVDHFNSNAKNDVASPSGKTPTTSPSPQIESQNRTIRKRKPKNTEGIWVIEKSLDKKNWVPERGILVMTRAEGEKLVGESNKNSFGIHYRLTRYEPSK